MAIDPHSLHSGLYPSTVRNANGSHSPAVMIGSVLWACPHFEALSEDAAMKIAEKDFKVLTVALYGALLGGRYREVA